MSTCYNTMNVSINDTLLVTSVYNNSEYQNDAMAIMICNFLK